MCPRLKKPFWTPYTHGQTVLDTAIPETVLEKRFDTVHARSETVGLSSEAERLERDLYPLWVAALKAGKINQGARDHKQFVLGHTYTKGADLIVSMAEIERIRKHWNERALGEGAAILATALHLEAMGADHGLKDVQFFLAISPWQPPLFVKDGLFDAGVRLDLPVLQIVGDNDMPVFIEAAPKFARSFTKLIAYHHPGQHVYPALNRSLSSKVDELLMMSDQFKIAHFG